MTITNQSVRELFNCDGSNTSFAIPFDFQDEDEVTVFLRNNTDPAAPTETELNNPNEFTITSGTTVETVSAYSSDYQLAIRRVTTIEQATDYVDGDAFPADDHESALDKLTQIDQELDERLDRAIHLAVTSDDTIDTELPLPEAYGYLRWNSTADQLQTEPFSVTAPLVFTESSSTWSIPVATALANGYLSSGDWTTFNSKQAALGFTPENVANKDTDGTMAANSDTKYPSQKAVVTYFNAGLGGTYEVTANKDTDGTLAANSDVKYASQKATKTYADTKLATSSFTDAAVTGKLITGFASGAGAVAGTDTILQAINKLDGNVGAKLDTASFTDAAVTGKLITGFTSGAGVVAAGDTILQAINKLDGNVAAKLDSSSFSDAGVTGKLITGYVSGAGAVAATDTILQAINKLNGNTAAKADPITYTNHAVYVGDGTTTPVALAVGATGEVLKGNTGADPTWGVPAAGAPTFTTNAYSANQTLAVGTVNSFDCTSGSLTATLPDATASAGQPIYVVKKDATINTLTIASAGSDVIGGDSETSLVLTEQNISVTLIPIGTVWYVF